MNFKKLALSITLLVISLFTFGCQDEAELRQIALQLRSSIIEDEQIIDKSIARQTKFYEAQRTTIDDARHRNISVQLDAFRSRNSAEAATTLSLEPQKQARMGTLMTYLEETHDKEYAVWEELYGSDQKDREELKSKIAKLERQKKVLTQVKENLNQLALAPNSKKRAQALLKFSMETHAAFKKTNDGGDQ